MEIIVVNDMMSIDRERIDRILSVIAIQIIEFNLVSTDMRIIKRCSILIKC